MYIVILSKHNRRKTLLKNKAGQENIQANKYKTSIQTGKITYRLYIEKKKIFLLKGEKERGKEMEK